MPGLHTCFAYIYLLNKTSTYKRGLFYSREQRSENSVDFGSSICKNTSISLIDKLVQQGVLFSLEELEIEG